MNNYLKVVKQRRIDGLFTIIADENDFGFKSGQIVDVVKNPPPDNSFFITKSFVEENIIYYPGIGRISVFELIDKMPPVKRRRGEKKYQVSTKEIQTKTKTKVKYQLILSDGNIITVNDRVFAMFDNLKTETFKFR